MKNFEVLNSAELTAVVGGKGKTNKILKCTLSAGSAFAENVWFRTNPYLAGAGLAYNVGKYCLGWGPQKVY